MAKPIGPICNIDCEYCYYLDKEQLFPTGENFRMTREGLREYIRQLIASSPGPQVDFAWQGGEPTLLGIDFFRQAVAFQKEFRPAGWRCSNAIQTNGTLLDDAWCQFLRAEQFLVGISIDGPAPLHDAYRVDKKGAPTHARVMEGLQLLQRHQVAYNVLCTVHAANSGHPLEIYRFFKEQGVQWLQFIPIVEHLGGDEASARSVSGRAYGTFLSVIFDEWSRHDIGRVFVQLFEECFSVWAGRPAGLCIFQETCGLGLAMEHNGDLYACDHFVTPAHKLGNIHLVPLEELVRSEEQVQFGLAKRETLPKQCRECEVRFMCNGGCPKDRFLLTTDGEPGLNYLCEGYRAFFNHADASLRQLVALWRRGAPPDAMMAALQKADEARWAALGRNDPCPCGSGRKYKACCLSRRA